MARRPPCLLDPWLFEPEVDPRPVQGIEVGVSAGGSWEVLRVRGRAEALHAAAGDLVGTGVTAVSRLIRVVDVTTPAVVLGSAQPDADVDLAAAEEAGIEVARRRSGGGAVLVGPDEALWVDVVVPAGDPLWHDDVGRATWWLGACWAAALREVTGQAAEVWRGPLVKTAWSSRICFAGLGPGEVTVDGVKVVGVSQRRTRQGALLQCAALLRWRPEGIIDVLALTPTERRQAALDVSSVAAGLGPIAGPLLDAFVAQVQGAAPTPTTGRL